MADSGLSESTKERASPGGRVGRRLPWKAYALAVAATALAWLLRWGLGRFVAELPPFITFYPAVALAAMLLGARAGVLATVLSAIAAGSFFVPPHYLLAIANLDHAVAVGLFTANGLLICWMANLLDRAQQRQTASEREYLLRALSEGIPDPLFIKDRDSRIITANPATVRAIGKPPEQIVGHTDAEFYDDPAVALAMMANDRRVMAAGQPEAVEEFVPGPEGVRTFLSVKTPWRDAEGRIIGIIGCARDITDRKRAEQTLRESESRFQVLAAGTFEGIAITESARFIDVNEQFARMLGYEPAELIGMEVAAALAPQERERVIANIRAGVESHIEHTLLRKDGSLVAVEAHGKNITYQNRSVRITAIHDISERKRAEGVLRRYELLASRSRDIFLFIDRNSGRLLEANTAAEIAYGYSREELLRLTLRDLRVDQARTTQLMAEADTRGGLFETVHRRRDGSAFPVEVSSQGTTIDGRRVLLSVVRDITERKRAEESLRQSEQRHRATFDNAAIGIVEVNDQDRFIAANNRSLQILGYRLEELLGMTVHELTYPEDRPASDVLNAQLHDGRLDRFDCEKRYLKRDGSPLWVHITVSAIRDPAGRYVRGIGTLGDISERKQAEQQLKEFNATLEHRVAERTAEAEARAAQLRSLAAELTRTEQRERRQLAQVLHDHLQQLLVASRYSIGVARRALGGSAPNSALQQADELLSKSLEVTRSLTAELSPPMLYKGSFAEALHWLASWMQEKHGLTVHVEADAGVDPPVEDVRLLLFQAARELLFNVVKHAKVSRASVRLDRVADDQARIVVADEGVGCDPQRCMQARPSGGGFGLLSLRERLELLSGRLEIDSAPGRGCRMTILTPLAAVPQTDAGIGSPSAYRYTPNGESPGERIRPAPPTS